MISRVATAAVLAATVSVPTMMVATLYQRPAEAADAPAPVVAQPVVSAPSASPNQAADKPAPSETAKSTPSETAEKTAPSDKVPEVVMAQVGGRKITVEQFMNYIKQDTRLVLKARTVSGKTDILHEMIVDRLIEEGMRQEGLLPKDRTPNAQDYLQAYQQLSGRYFPKPTAIPPEAELYQYYQQHPELFGIPAMVRVSQIQFRYPENADEKTKAAVKAKAEDALKRLQAGESFSVLAEQLTENPLGKVTKGDMGFMQPEKDAWLKKAVEGLSVGQFSAVLESAVGYEIILVQDKRDAMVAPYANVRDNIISRVQQDAQAKAREDYAWKLAKQLVVTVEMPELKNAVPQAAP